MQFLNFWTHVIFYLSLINLLMAQVYIQLSKHIGFNIFDLYVFFFLTYSITFFLMIINIVIKGFRGANYIKNL